MAAPIEGDPATIALFLSIGLKESPAKELARNKKKSKILVDVIHEAGLSGGCEDVIGALLLNVATSLSEASWQHRPALLRYVVDRRIATTAQLEAAYKYLKSHDALDAAELERACGVGISFTPAQIKASLAASIEARRAELLADRYVAVPAAFVAAKQALEWGDARLIKEEFDAHILELLGPKTDADNAAIKAKAKKASAPAAAPAAASAAPTTAAANVASEETSAAAPAASEFSNIEEMYAGRDLKEARNSQATLARVREATGGKIVTRFPPEPNGYLHLGHCKAMRFNFGLAARTGGNCILRFDDTNPDAESVEYIDNIVENVHWMGHKPSSINFSSDYFQTLYELAQTLIRKGHAFVCHQSKAEIEACRESRQPSPYRDRSVDENLRLFENMRLGLYGEGEATLRMKGDLQSPNPCMWDMVAYRVKLTPHPHAGDKWCIYPSYDYTHCIIDSLENISYSLCTLEFEVRRDTYYLLLDQLDLYKPMVWEYNRLNITHNVLSKRRLLALVMGKHMRGWNDPRMLTINGLRRRGYTPEALNRFCDLVGVSRADQTIKYEFLEFCLRQDLDTRAPRVMAVLDPLRCTITNWPADRVHQCTAPNFPKDESRGTRNVPLTRVVYIDRSDFKEEDTKGFYGLSIGKEVHLKYAFNMRCDGVVRDPATGAVIELLCTVDETNANKPKGNLHWVSAAQPGAAPLAIAEVRLYDHMFKSEDPMAVDAWLQDLNPTSEVVLAGALCEPSLATAKLQDRFQFERVGFFVVDDDSAAGRLVFNRSTPLKESKEKK